MVVPSEFGFDRTAEWSIGWRCQAWSEDSRSTCFLSFWVSHKPRHTAVAVWVCARMWRDLMTMMQSFGASQLRGESRVVDMLADCNRLKLSGLLFLTRVAARSRKSMHQTVGMGNSLVLNFADLFLEEIDRTLSVLGGVVAGILAATFSRRNRPKAVHFKGHAPFGRFQRCCESRESLVCRRGTYSHWLNADPYSSRNCSRFELLPARAPRGVLGDVGVPFGKPSARRQTRSG